MLFNRSFIEAASSIRANKKARPSSAVHEHAPAPEMAKAEPQRPAYLTYPAFAGFTVTFSRGIAPRSAAGCSPGALRKIYCS